MLGCGSRIAGNDLCKLCKNNPASLPDNYIAYIDQAITKLITQIPRVYINLVNIIDVTKLAAIDVGNCHSMHELLCECTTKGAEVLALVQETGREYQVLIEELAAQPKFHGDTFTVEMQPFFLDTMPPTLPDGTVDVSYFAPDCFHFSLKSHAIAGVALWNSMVCILYWMVVVVVVVVVVYCGALWCVST